MSKLSHLFTQFPWKIFHRSHHHLHFHIRKVSAKYHITINTILSWSFHPSKPTYLYIPCPHPIYTVSCFFFTAVTLHLTLQFTIYLLFVSLKQNKIFVCIHSTKTRGYHNVINVSNGLAAKVDSSLLVQ